MRRIQEEREITGPMLCTGMAAAMLALTVLLNGCQNPLSGNSSASTPSNPTVTLSPPAVSILNVTSANQFTATYSGASAVSLRSSDIQLNRTGSANCVAAVSSIVSNVATIDISNCTGNDTVSITILAGTAINASGNLASASAASAVFTVDNSGITSI